MTMTIKITIIILLMIIMITIIIAHFPDDRFVYLFGTKMTQALPYYTKTYSLLTEYPNITSTVNSRSAVDCALICLAGTNRCQHFIYNDGEEIINSCHLLLWVKFVNWSFIMRSKTVKIWQHVMFYHLNVSVRTPNNHLVAKHSHKVYSTSEE